MALWVAVNGLQDGESVNNEVFNRPINNLTERTNYLYGRVKDLAGNGTYESVRLTQVTLDSGTYAPVVGDFVYVNEVSGVYAKALSAITSDSVVLAADSAYSVGLLVSINPGNLTGTVVIYGKESLSTSGSAWDLSALLETGETFRNGPYYLSNEEAGKMTALPLGPSIYLGYFMEDPDNAGYGGYAILNPQYKDLKEAHTHRNYPLYAQPAGTQELSGPTPVDTHSVLGFEPDGVLAGLDRVARLIGLGSWSSTTSVQYTIWLSNSADPTQILGATTAPTDYSDCYLHWESSDATEINGAARVWAYNSPVAVGTKGLYINLENPDAGAWDTPYVVASDAEDKRTWTLDAPEQLRGWLANTYKQYFSDFPGTDNGYSFILQGGPHTSSDDRIADDITVKCGEIHEIAYTSVPVAGKKVTIITTDFVFGTDVVIGVDADASFQNLLDVVIAADLTGIDVALNTDDSHFMVSAPTTTTVSTDVAGAIASLKAAGAGSLLTGNVGLLVYDEYHKALVDSDSYWAAAGYWVPKELTNGLSIIAIPYDSDGTAASADTVAIADYWSSQFADEAPGSNFVYAMGMHTGLAEYYPPTPKTGSVLILNGVELDMYDQFPTDATYRVSNTSLYWYPDALGSVPWPRDWVSVDDPGSAVYAQNMLYHLVRLAAGEVGLVTSLTSAPGSPIRVLQCGTNDPASIGDLALDLNLNFQEEAANLAGFQVFKGLSGQKMLKGPVVERIISSDASISIIPTVGSPTGQGVVDLSIGDRSYSGDFEEVALENAKQELIGMFPYVRLMGWSTGGSGNIPTAFVAKFRVPHDIGDPLVPPNFKVIVYMTVFGESDIPWVGGGNKQYAGIDFSYSILPDFNPITSTDAWNALDASLPDGLITMTDAIHAEIPIGKYNAGVPGTPIYSAYDPMLIHNNPAEGTDVDRKVAQVLGGLIPEEGQLASWNPSWDAVVKPGSLVGIRVERANITAGTEYTGSLGFINMRWKLVSVA